MVKHALHASSTPPVTADVYCAALDELLALEIPFLVGGGYAMLAYTGIARTIKDLDLFLMRDDVDRALEGLSALGYQTELTHSHWLAKASFDGRLIDIIFNSGNACCAVDEQWFRFATEQELFGLTLKICPVVETIWQKSFIMERERYDGADVAHLLRACGPTLDWQRLRNRFGTKWKVLLTHLVLFGFIYPDEQSVIPTWLMQELTDRLRQENNDHRRRSNLCFGTLLSREQYLTDIDEWGYHDARLTPTGNMTQSQIDDWTPKNSGQE